MDSTGHQQLLQESRRNCQTLLAGGELVDRPTQSAICQRVGGPFIALMEALPPDRSSCPSEAEAHTGTASDRLDASDTRAADTQSLRLFNPQTPRTSASVKGRWTEEYRVIKTALARQRVAKNKAIRGRSVCCCIHEKEYLSTAEGLAATARAACEAFHEAARLAPLTSREFNGIGTAKTRLWGPAVMATIEEVAKQAAAASAASRDFNSYVSPTH
ncbi:hypothetical protein cyc_06109 [Cyclospora cayetanensis]|uniref:Uncharacterized protein n=1 Tax=Cyclospora cayetanensis TaxID=88456 RepID=A0A1D3D446_9EIME|nr:hypothetical protein cyc_06109 [Cyclospora cayetanensis]